MHKDKPANLRLQKLIVLERELAKRERGRRRDLRKNR